MFSYVVHYHPPLPGFASPHPIALVDMAEGVRLMGAMDGTAPDAMAVGLPVSTGFLRRENLAAFRFAKA